MISPISSEDTDIKLLGFHLQVKVQIFCVFSRKEMGDKSNSSLLSVISIFRGIFKNDFSAVLKNILKFLLCILDQSNES